MAKEDVIKHRTIHNLMDMASSLKINWRASKLTKEFVDYIIIEVLKQGEDLARYRKETVKVLMEKDILQALKWMGYNKFAQSKVDEVREKGDKDVDSDKEVEAGRYSFEEEDT